VRASGYHEPSRLQRDSPGVAGMWRRPDSANANLGLVPRDPGAETGPQPVGSRSGVAIVCEVKAKKHGVKASTPRGVVQRVGRVAVSEV